MNFEFMYPAWFIAAAGLFFAVMILAHFIEAHKNKLETLWVRGLETLKGGFIL